MLTAVVKCLIWADASAQIGLGHIFRASTLATALKGSRGASSILLTGAADEELLPIKDAFGSIRKVPPKSSLQAAFQQLVGSVERCNVPLVIIDKPSYPAALCRLLKRFKSEHPRPAFVAFGAAEAPPGCVDMIIDANRNPQDAAEFDGSTTVALFGPEYAALAPQFAEARSRFSVRDSLERLVISMGGSDPSFATLIAHQAAARLEGLMIDIVLGPAFSETYWERLRPKIDETRTCIHRNVSQKELGDMLASADGCIVSGGITMFEAAAVGLPAIVVSQNPPQLENARRLASYGAVVNAGLFSQASAEDITSILAGWQSSCGARAELSTRARQTVDAMGLERICAAMLGLLDA
ncbi:MAG: hypothetical protein JW759_10540 [Candidatus Coatesbacteria bacterium]|nr:hypothetical protein [Candidatus Coatesbacteria bacterium]